MAADNNYEEILEEVCEKINNIDSIKEIDIIDIKNSIESIENLITDTQSKLNFQEIKEKLENIAFQVDSCNDTLLKDLYNDINELKDSSKDVGQHIENLQNVQNLALTSAEFEEYQKQQLDLALKTNENIFNELNAIKENSKVVDNTENIKQIETQLENLHKNLSGYIEQLVSKLEKSPNLEDIGAIVSDVNSVSQKNIKQTNALIKVLQTKFDAFQSDFENKDFENQITKISEIYDSLNIINAWIEKVGYINKSIENVYARLGASIDFDDVAEKIDIIYENISALNNWTMKIDNVDSSTADMQSKIAALANFMEDTKNITNTISEIKNRLDSSFSDNLDLEDLSNKMDIVYENLSAINEWANKVDIISGKVADINNSIENDLINKVDNISDKLSDINNFQDSDLIDKVDDISDKISNINNTFEDDFISSKIDLIYENIGLLNEWVSKIDGVAQKSEELDFKFTKTNDNLNIKIDEISGTLSKASKIIEDFPNLKDKLEDLSGELHTITSTTKNDTESYIYTLLDIESDFLKLHKFLDDNTKITSQDINSLKERFSELNDDISSISIRTNKLILSADDANKEFKTYLELFKNTINELETKKQNFNPEYKFSLLSEKVAEMVKLLQSSVNANNNLNNAFIYLAEWIDATGNMLNIMQIDLAAIKSTPAEKYDDTAVLNEFKTIKETSNNLTNRIGELEDAFVNFKTEDLSEIKDLLTGIMLQLNTSLTPDIDSLNEKIDKLSEENSNNYTKLEILLKEKINQQSKQILALEEKFEDLTSKFNTIIEVVNEDNKNYEIKDILNYMNGQIAAINKAINIQQNNTNSINQDNTAKLSQISDKLSSFDNNIYKIVSYIEED